MVKIETIESVKEYNDIKKDIVEIFNRINKDKLLELHKYIKEKL
ncbi:hypothetical protein [Clostridium sp. L74]|nr:hypothetical protein [Clostridium sp. L74]KOR24139.1 hypothetical protein ND00_28450 [Clostridium sp. L74]